MTIYWFFNPMEILDIDSDGRILQLPTAKKTYFTLIFSTSNSTSRGFEPIQIWNLLAPIVSLLVEGRRTIIQRLSSPLDLLSDARKPTTARSWEGEGEPPSILPCVSFFPLIWVVQDWLSHPYFFLFQMSDLCFHCLNLNTSDLIKLQFFFTFIT